MEHEDQIVCGNCQAFNDRAAAVCVNCTQALSQGRPVADADQTNTVTIEEEFEEYDLEPTRLALLDDVVINYYRLRVLQLAIVLSILLLAAIGLFQPALFMLPALGIMIFWVYNKYRFISGGDRRGVFNRDCAMMFTLCCVLVMDVVLFIGVVAVATGKAKKHGEGFIASRAVFVILYALVLSTFGYYVFKLRQCVQR